MVTKTLMNKKGDLKMTGLVVILLLGMTLFYGMFSYMSEQASNNDPTLLDNKYNETFDKLAQVNTNVNTRVTNIQNNTQFISESGNPAIIAWNAFVGLGRVLLLPVNFIGDSIDAFNAMILPLDTVPAFYRGIALTAIIAIIIFLVLAILKGDQNRM